MISLIYSAFPDDILNDFMCNEREIMKCSNVFFSFLPIMHLLPGPKTKLSNTLSGPLFQQVLSTRETRSRRCSVRVGGVSVEFAGNRFRLAKPVIFLCL